MGAAERVREQLGEAVLARTEKADGLVAHCVAGWQAACAELPAVEVPLDEFVTLLRSKLEEAHNPTAAAQALDFRELLLATGCAHGSRPALDRIDAELVGAIRGALASMKLDDAAIDETLQRVREKLLVAGPAELPLICKYAGQGTLRSLVRVVAVRTALMSMRKTKHERLEGGEEGALERAVGGLDPELRSIRQQYRTELKEAFERAVAALTSRQRNVLRLQLVDGVAVDQIAKLYQVHRVSVSRWLGEARRQIAGAVRQDLGERLALDSRELDSLVRLVQSQVDLSVERVLRTQPGAVEAD